MSDTSSLRTRVSCPDYRYGSILNGVHLFLAEVVAPQQLSQATVGSTRQRSISQSCRSTRDYERRGPRAVFPLRDSGKVSYQSSIMNPPSTWRHWPVMLQASSEAMNATTVLEKESGQRLPERIIEVGLRRKARFQHMS